MGPARGVYDAPDKVPTPRSDKRYHLAPQLKPCFENVRNELFIISPYFVPGKAETAFLTELAKRGVRVRVITNSLSSTDVPIVHAGYVSSSLKVGGTKPSAICCTSDSLT